jgi:hypothetical protein
MMMMMMIMIIIITYRISWFPVFLSSQNTDFWPSIYLGVAWLNINMSAQSREHGKMTWLGFISLFIG